MVSGTGETGMEQVTRIEGARVILPDDIVDTDLCFSDGRIVEIGGAVAADHVIDGRGKVLAPALVDIHGDAFERQIMPRPNVFFPLDAALLDTDRQLAGNGIATAYHALTLSWEPGLRSVERGRQVLDALARLEPRLSVENRVQLRWETFAFEAIDLIEGALQGAHVPSIAFNDHTSMKLRDKTIPIQERLFEQRPDYAVISTGDPEFRTRAGDAPRTGLDKDGFLDLLKSVWARRPDVPEAIARVAAMGQRVGAPMLSHDDTQDETRAYYRGLGARISEFPMRVPVARQAVSDGDWIVFGAPNVVRGGSHIGSPSAADMVEDGLCHVLASDYFYPAMLAAVARLHRERRGTLPDLWKLVSTHAARASNLTDRGEIAPGQRADLVLLDWPDGETPRTVTTWVRGKMAFGTIC